MRLRLLAALFPVLVLAVLGGIWLGGHPSVLPAPLRDTLVDDEEAQLVDEVLDLVEDDYYREVDREELVDRGLRGAIASLNDRFSQYLDPESFGEFARHTDGRFSGVGMEVLEHPLGLRVSRVYEGSPAEKAGIESGDLITGADGRSLADRPSTFSTALIRGEPGTQVKLKLRSGGRTRTLEVTRADVSVPVVQADTREVGGTKLGWVQLSSFTNGAHAEVGGAVRKQLRDGAEGIVLDLRDNGGGLLDEAVLVSSVFVPEGPIVSTDGRTRGKRTYESEGGSIDEDVPVVVLVNRNSASASEIVAGALQDTERAQVVGTRTFGKGVFQEVEPLSNGGALDITVGEYFTPKGRNLGGGGVKQGRGLAPDVRALDDPKTENRDEGLRRALTVLARELDA